MAGRPKSTNPFAIQIRVDRAREAQDQYARAVEEVANARRKRDLMVIRALEVIGYEGLGRMIGLPTGTVQAIARKQKKMMGQRVS